jgi:epoxide hydrolase 4
MNENVDRVRVLLASGVELDAWLSGPADAPLVVFLHGFPEAGFVWTEVIEELQASCRGPLRCVAPDLRGYAGSSRPAEVEAYRAKHLVNDVVQLIAALSPGRPALSVVAHDWGGAVAWNLAALQPASLERLVIINSPHPATFLRDLQHDAAQQAASAYMNFLCRPDAASLLAANDYARLWPFFTNMGAADAGHEGGGWLTEALREQYREVWNQGLDGALNYYRASPLKPPTADDRAVLDVVLPSVMTTVRVPTLVLWGLADTALPARLLDGLEQHVQDLRVVQLPGATHWVIHEQPKQLVGAISEFLG